MLNTKVAYLQICATMYVGALIMCIVTLFTCVSTAVCDEHAY